MKNSGIFILLVLIITACNKPNKKIEERINATDSVAINFFKGDGTTDTVVKVKIIKDKKIVSQLAQLIGTAQASPNIKCGYDGSLHFFKGNIVAQDIDFRMNAVDCSYFTFKQEGQLTATKLSAQAKLLLESLKK